MRKILPIILTLTSMLTHGQIELEKFDELVLVDYQNWNYQSFHGRTYLIKLNESPLKLYDLKIMTGMELFEQLKTIDPKRWEKINSLSPDSIDRYFNEIKILNDEYLPIPEVVNEIDVETLENLKKQIQRNIKRGEILKELRLTKDSIDKHLDEYLLKYLTEKKIKYKPEKLSYCKNKLKDYELFNRTAMAITHGSATSDYPTVSIEFRNGNDTLAFHTYGQHPFMLPWFDKTDKEYSYNPNLSKAIGQLLPEYKYSNRDRLLGLRSMHGDYLKELYFGTISQNCINDKRKLITQ
jgi:D-ribose pyranose/furanose isomerase RbsD